MVFTGRLQAAGIRISMDGWGRRMDNIFIERLWRSLQHEALYLHEIVNGFSARRVIGEWIDFCSTKRPHMALGGQTPAEAYRGETAGLALRPGDEPGPPQPEARLSDVVGET